MKKIILSAVMTALLVSGCGGGGGGGKKPEVEKPISFVKIFENYKIKIIENTNDGGFITAGQYNNVLVIRKYDKNGSQQWEYISGNDFVYPNIIYKTSDNGYIVSGSCGYFNGNNLREGDAIVIKLSQDGKFQWYKNIGGGGMMIAKVSPKQPMEG